MILLDADVVIDLLRNYPPAIAWMEQHSGEQLAMPGYAAMELIQGCRNLRHLDETSIAMRRYRPIWPSAAACQLALTASGRLYLSYGIGILDLLNAYTAIELGVELHTFNIKHYCAIPMLRTVQPYTR
jgi:hypothetical protein